MAYAWQNTAGQERMKQQLIGQGQGSAEWFGTQAGRNLIDANLNRETDPFAASGGWGGGSDNRPGTSVASGGNGLGVGRYASYGDGSAYVAPTAAAPAATPGAIRSAAFGTYNDDPGTLAALKAYGLDPNAPAGGGGGRDMRGIADEIRARKSRLENFDTNFDNPFAPGNQGLETMKGNQLGETMGLFAAAKNRNRADAAARGAFRTSGLAAGMDARASLGAAKQLSGQYANLDAQNYQKAADFETYRRDMKFKLGQALDAQDTGRFDQLQNAYKNEQDYRFNEAYNPMRLEAAGLQNQQGRVAAKYADPMAEQALRSAITGNQAGSLNLQRLQQVMPSEIQAEIANNTATPEKIRLGLEQARREGKISEMDAAAYAKQMEHESFWAPLTNLTRGVQNVAGLWRSLQAPEIMLGPGGNKAAFDGAMKVLPALL